MKTISFTLLTIAAFLICSGGQGEPACAAKAPHPSIAGRKSGAETRPLFAYKNILVVYFSYSGNTREIANQIHESVGGDIFEIQTIRPYPDDYDAVTRQARQELNSGHKPALKRIKIDNIGSYDLIFLGYPIWWGTIPAPVRTFLSDYNLSGKTVVPFCTHTGSGLGRSVKDISKLCPKSTVLDGVAVWGKDVKTAQSRVSEWLRKIALPE